jgi:hypothetical protein
MQKTNGLINNEKELKKSYDDTTIQFWEVDDGRGDRRHIFREDLTYEQFKEKINYYLKQIIKKQEGAFIKVIC